MSKSRVLPILTEELKAELKEQFGILWYEHIPPSMYLNPDNFVTQAREDADVERVTRYARARAREACTQALKYDYMLINAASSWTLCTQDESRSLSNLSDVIGIGSHTDSFLRGVLKSGIPIIVVRSNYRVDGSLSPGCNGWLTFTNTHTGDAIDSNSASSSLLSILSIM